MKTKFIPWIGLDFKHSDSLRTTCFQLCEKRETSNSHPAAGLIAVATVDLNQHGEVERFAAVPYLKKREAGIVRLARIHQKRNTPYSPAATV